MLSHFFLFKMGSHQPTRPKKCQCTFESNRSADNHVPTPSRRTQIGHAGTLWHDGFRGWGHLGSDSRRQVALKTTCARQSSASIALLGNRSGDEDGNWPSGEHPPPPRAFNVRPPSPLKPHRRTPLLFSPSSNPSRRDHQSSRRRATHPPVVPLPRGARHQARTFGRP
jgi:hypothetical protein